MTAPRRVTEAVRDALARITAAWRAGHFDDMAPLIAEDMVMVFPGFGGRLVGRAALIESFRAFARDARVLDYRQEEAVVDGVGTVAVAQYPFEMVYERAGARWRATGWDVWVFERRSTAWTAVWRTMQALAEQPADDA